MRSPGLRSPGAFVGIALAVTTGCGGPATSGDGEAGDDATTGASADVDTGTDDGASSGGPCPPGRERCPCLTDGTCLPGLECSMDVCVDPGDGDGASGDGDGTSTSTGDGDGTSTGDGDGTSTGDGDGTSTGDGDGTTSGDGDGTSTGDGDGTSAGDGDGDVLRVATWNVRLLFDDVCDSGDCGGGSFEQLPSAGEYAARITEVAGAIALVDPDVVMLQEVENQVVVDDLAAALAPRYAAAVHGEYVQEGGLDVAMLTAVSPLTVARHAMGPIPLPGGGTTWFTRQFLEVQILWSDTPVSMFVGHFKSKVDDDPDRRLAEALEAERIVTDRAMNLNGLVILGGDFNDYPGSPPLDAIEASGTLDRVAAELLPNDATVEYMGTPEAIDHLFVSTISPGGSFVAGTAEIWDDGGWWGLAGSDHRLLVGDFWIQ